MTNLPSNPAKTDKIRVAVIGAGIRAVSYLINVPEAIHSRIQLVAIADPNKEKRKMLMDRFAAWGVPVQYDDGDELLENASFDALIIGSYNTTHADYAIKAFDTGATILLEKPVATSVEQCQRLWQKFQESDNRRVFIGFVLRYAPFYRQLRTLLDQQAIGQLLAIDADENLSQSLTSVFLRAWRRDDRVTGGFMVEKCCHDFDILHMLTGSRVKRVFSIGRRTHFILRPRDEQHRRFDPEYIREIALDYGDIHIKKIFEETSDESVYTNAGDVPDHQAVMLEFEDGTLVNFMACLGQPRTTRRIRLFGSNGSLEGDIDRGTILQDIPFERHLGAETITHHICADESGHHGADSVLNDAFWNAASGGEVINMAGIREGIEASLVAIAVEQSKRSGVPVDLEALRYQIFREENAFSRAEDVMVNA